jgi:hypothetical protein
MRLGTRAWGCALLLLAAWAQASYASASLSPRSTKVLSNLSKNREVVLPKTAKICNLSSASRAGRLACTYCNSETTVAAADRIALQVGSCGNATKVAEFTRTEVKLFAPLAIDALNIAGDLVVGGTSTHWGLETFYGEVFVRVIDFD